MDMFGFALGFLILACAVIHWYTRQVQQQVKDSNYRSFQQSYLIVYLLAAAGDWLQGPHVYALYESYGIQKHEIEVLFIAGFGSSMIFGTIVASLADKYGRRNTCMVYGILYGMSCVTKHFPNFYILLVGRLLAGMATSILFSAFESWLVNEHRRRNFEPETLGIIFANAYFGNSVVAILSGIVAQLVANNFGYVYMVAMMMGSNSFKLLCNYATPESFMRSIVFVSTLCMSVPIFMPNDQAIMFVAFLVFEFCIGVFWPAMATMRSKYVPEEARATVMNYFRIPLNLIVVIILLKDFHLKVIFSSCVLFLALAAISMVLLHKLTLHIKQVSPLSNVLIIPQHGIKSAPAGDADGRPTEI
ncbi:unnamed protein product [Rotaria magnacalcarata]|uniref:Molybdate-anion transporter n=1 Tax=Rotaria magnacalcarata TaxID=392030 RepID=A0A8S2JPA6_9BILA|nr:unnamed protein product [Rotaria magnacalcarata]